MGLQQSKEELLYDQVNYGNIEGIKALRREGAGLEYVDRDGRTPLIAACLKPELYNVAKALLELGANVNKCRPGRYGGTPLHHAAKRGLEQTVKLLLSHGANPLVMNDDCQTPLDIAREKGHANVVRTIESHICLFSGWLRELHGPGFLEVLAPQFLSRKVWVVVLPCGSRNLQKPFKLELSIYASTQDAKPRTTVALWKAGMEEPAFGQPDPAVIISEASISRPRRRRRKWRRCTSGQFRQTRIKLAPVNESDKQQLQRFCSACKGIPQESRTTSPFSSHSPAAPATAPPAADDLELAMAINASIQSAAEEGITVDHTHAPHRPSASNSMASFSGIVNHGILGAAGAPSRKQALSEWPMPAAPSGAPSAPSIQNHEISESGPVHYPSIDSSSVNMSVPAVDNPHTPEDDKNKGESSSCVICLDAPVEGACVPCGHMAGCMSCLTEVKEKKWGCPICRSKIDQIIRVYAV